MKKILAVIAYKSAYGFIYSVSLLPMRFLYGFSFILYVLAYYVIGYRKLIVIQNLSRAFPDKKYDEVRDVAKSFYASFTSYFAEIIKSLSVSSNELDVKLILVNSELIEENIQKGKDVIVCLGHCGNWEILNILPNKLACDMYAVYKPLQSPIFNRLMIKLRSRFGMKLIQDQSVTRHILTNKSSHSVYLFLADQCPRIKDEKYRFDLLNQATYHFSGMEKLARITQSAVVYLHIKQISKGRYAIICKSICEEAGVTDPGFITKKFVDLLNENIQEEPHGWLWSHKRFKK